ncbi:MAG: HD family phosphohydrolase [Myxococcaceae bacterium]
MADPASPTPPKDASPEQLGFKLPPQWSGRVANFALLAVIAVACTFILSPGLYSQQIPELGPQDVGKPFRSTSPYGFKAGRDYDLPDSTTTEQRRQEARAQIVPVYDYNPAVVSEIRASVGEAFAQMHAVVDQWDAEQKKLSDEAAAQGTKKKKPESDAAAEDTLEVRLRAERKAFEQKAFPLEDEDFQALVTAKFSKEAEAATLSLIERAYPPTDNNIPAAVVNSRDELTQASATAITVRPVGAGNEYRVSALAPSVLDVREARAELDRFASIPGNLLPDSPGTLKRAVLRLAKRQIRPNLTINLAETAARRNAAAASVKDVVVSIKKGEKVLGDGELITESHLMKIGVMRAQTDRLDLFQLQLGGAGIVALVIGAAYAFNKAAFRRFRPTRKDGILLGLLLISMLGFVHLWMTVSEAIHDRYPDVPLEALYFAVPVAAGAMLVRFILSEELALFFAIVLSVLAGVMQGNSLSFGIYALVGSLVAADRIKRARDRLGIFKAGLITGLVNACTVLCLAFAEGKGLQTESWVTALFALVGTSIGVPVVLMTLTPLIEASFGYASDIKLLELANLNHPALKELIVQAPGTYHHSIIMGSLVEAAAENIGANPLLARSCAYYHDIGKGRNPLYFGENQKGDNRHDTLAPAMSAVIIKRHVTEGLEMARQYKLPKLVADAIPQHHGTRVVGYFFHKATKEQEGRENPQPIDESVYRYPGPKPQFREAALVMIADAVEAASRAMPEPTSPKLQALVQKLINGIFSEGQLDECELTLKDLNLIAQSFVNTLEGIYHARPQYPPGAVSPRMSDSKIPPLQSVGSKLSDGKRPAGT